MRVNTILPAAALVASASAKTVRVDVGKDGLSFSPDVITAAKGDTLSFHFYPQRHSVVLGTKDKACMPADSGMFYSGFIPTSNGEASSTFEVMVNSTDAMYIYCSSGQHCQEGMAAVVNGDKAGLDKYKDDAAKASENVSPKQVTGGTVMSGSSGSMTSGSMASSSASSMSGSMTSGSAMSTTTTGGSGSKTSSAAASSTSGSGAASSTPSSTAKPAAAAGFKASVAGVLAAAGGVAALML